MSPSVERWIVSRLASGASASEFASHTPCTASHATTGSLARVDGPGGTEFEVSPGRIPSRHVRPPSLEVAKPMLAAPPVRFRPTWKTATVVWPTVCESGSTSDSCWLSAFYVPVAVDAAADDLAVRSIRSRASAATMSRPAPHDTRSTPPSYSTAIRSFPARATTRSEPSRPGEEVGARRADVAGTAAVATAGSARRGARSRAAHARRTVAEGRRGTLAGVTGPRRLSHAISEGDGISLIVAVDGPQAARARRPRRRGGARRGDARGDPRGHGLPIVRFLGDSRAGDACIVGAREAIRARRRRRARRPVAHEDELEEALERFDPELFVLASRDEDEPLQHVLDLLSDVPAGKLVIADTGGATTQAELDELERAGIDAVLVRSA